MIKTFFDLFWIVLSNKVGHLLLEPGFDPHSTPRFRRIISDVEFYVTNSLVRCRKIRHGKFRHTNPTVDDQPYYLGLEFTITQLLSFVGTSKTCKKPFLSFLTPIRVI